MKMLNKSAAVFAVKEDLCKTCDPVINYVIEQLDTLNYNIQKVTITSNKDAVIASEIENCIKQSDVIIFIGGIGGPHSDMICQIVSKVFHQKLAFDESLTQLLATNVNIPMHSKILKFSTGAVNNSTVICPAVHVQGLLLLVCDFELLKLSFANVVAPFLRDLNRRARFKRVLTLKSEENVHKIPHRENVDVNYNVVDNNTKVTLTSTNLSCLHAYESELKATFGNGLECEEDGDIRDLVYKQIDYSHIRSSIECIEECFSRYGPENVFISFNGGKDCTVLLHLTLGVFKKNYPNFKEKKLFCIYVENNFPFPELNSFIEQCQWYYNLNILKLSKNIKDSLDHVLKTNPNMKACLMGTRRTDPFSEHLQSFQMTDPNWPQIMRVSPLLDWHYSEIWDYLLHLKVPYCSLYDVGYTSLGSKVNSVSNPALILHDSLKDCKTYLPAYKLLNADLERHGRKQT